MASRNLQNLGVSLQLQKENPQEAFKTNFLKCDLQLLKLKELEF